MCRPAVGRMHACFFAGAFPGPNVDDDMMADDGAVCCVSLFGMNRHLDSAHHRADSVLF